MSFQDVPWADGELITETKLDQMQGNADLLRNEYRFQTVAQTVEVLYRDTEISGVTWTWGRVQIVLGANTYYSSWSQLGASGFWPINGMPRNQAISGLSAGTVYTIQVILQLGIASQTADHAFEVGRASLFFLEDMAYFSSWADDMAQAGELVFVRRFTAIVTRVNEGL